MIGVYPPSIDHHLLQSFCSFYILVKRIPLGSKFYYYIGMHASLLQLIIIIISMATNISLKTHIRENLIVRIVLMCSRLFESKTGMTVDEYEILTILTFLQTFLFIYIIYRFLTIRSVWFVFTSKMDFLFFVAVIISLIMQPISTSILIKLMFSYWNMGRYKNLYIITSVISFIINYITNAFCGYLRCLSIDILPLPDLEWYQKYSIEKRLIIYSALIELTIQIDNSIFANVVQGCFVVWFIILGFNSIYKPHYIQFKYRITSAATFFTCSIVSLWILISSLISIDQLTSISLALFSFFVFYIICLRLENIFVIKISENFSQLKTVEDIKNLHLSAEDFADRFCVSIKSSKCDFSVIEKAMEVYPNSYPIALIAAKISVLASGSGTASLKAVSAMRRLAGTKRVRWMQICLFDMISVDQNSLQTSPISFGRFTGNLQMVSQEYQNIDASSDSLQSNDNNFKKSESKLNSDDQNLRSIYRYSNIYSSSEINVIEASERDINSNAESIIGSRVFGDISCDREATTGHAEAALQAATKKFSYSLYLFWTDVHLGRLDRLPALASDATGRYKDVKLIIEQLYGGWHESPVFQETQHRVAALSNITDSSMERGTGITNIIMNGAISSYKVSDGISTNIDSSTAISKESTIAMIQEKGKYALLIFQHIAAYLVYYFVAIVSIFTACYVRFGSTHPPEWDIIQKGVRLSELATAASFAFTWDSFNISSESKDRLNSHLGYGWEFQNVFFGTRNYTSIALILEKEIRGLSEAVAICASKPDCMKLQNDLIINGLSESNASLPVKLSVIADQLLDITEETKSITVENVMSLHDYIVNYTYKFSKTVVEEVTYSFHAFQNNFVLMIIVLLIILEVSVLGSATYMNVVFRMIFSNFLAIPKPFVHDLITKIEAPKSLPKCQIFDANENYHLQQLEQRIAPAQYVSNTQRVVFLFFHAFVIYLLFSVVISVFFGETTRSRLSMAMKHANVVPVIEIPSHMYAFGYRMVEYIKDNNDLSMQRLKSIRDRLNAVTDSMVANARDSFLSDDFLFKEINMSIIVSYSIYSTASTILTSSLDFFRDDYVNHSHTPNCEHSLMTFTNLFSLISITTTTVNKQIEKAFIADSEKAILKQFGILMGSLSGIWIIYLATISMLRKFMPMKHFADVVLSSGADLFLRSPEWFVRSIERGKLDFTAKSIDESTLSYLFDMILLIDSNNRIVFAPRWVKNRLELDDREYLGDAVEKVTGHNIRPQLPPTKKIVIDIGFTNDNSALQIALTLMPLEFIFKGEPIHYVAVIKDNTILASIIRRKKEEERTLCGLVSQLVPHQVAGAVVDGVKVGPQPCFPFVASFFIEGGWVEPNILHEVIQKYLNESPLLTFLGRSTSVFRVGAGIFGASPEDAAEALIKFSRDLVIFCSNGGGRIKTCIASVDMAVSDLISEPCFDFDILGIGMMSLTEAATKIPWNVVVFSMDVFNAVFDEDIDSMFIGEFDFGSRRTKFFMMQDSELFSRRNLRV